MAIAALVSATQDTISPFASGGSNPFLDDYDSDDSPRPVLAAKNKRFEKVKHEELTAGSPLLDYVKTASTPRLDGRRTPKPLNKMSSGYIDTDASELGAIPMRGKHRDDWLKIQVTTFTNWVNDRLSGSRANYSGNLVHDLKMDFEDGILLIRLLENLTGKKLQGVVRNPIFTAQKIANLDVLFTFMKSEGVRLTAIGEIQIAIYYIIDLLKFARFVFIIISY